MIQLKKKQSWFPNKDSSGGNEFGLPSKWMALTFLREPCLQSLALAYLSHLYKRRYVATSGRQDVGRLEPFRSSLFYSRLVYNKTKDLFLHYYLPESLIKEKLSRIGTYIFEIHLVRGFQNGKARAHKLENG